MNTAEKESDDDRRISIICFSLTGKETAQKLKEGLEKCGYHTELYKKSRYLEDSIAESTADWTAEHFHREDGLIFVGACGIAVRSIAPQVASKKSDPAVLVVDECGQFVISLLSGHLGGANELSLKAAQILGAQPVVTTATDLHKRFAVDVFSRKNDCEILFMKAAKEVSAALLAGKTVGFYSEFPFVGALPNGLTECDAEGIPLVGESVPEAGVAVTIHPAGRLRLRHRSCRRWLHLEWAAGRTKKLPSSKKRPRTVSGRRIFTVRQSEILQVFPSRKMSRV